MITGLIDQPTRIIGEGAFSTVRVVENDHAELSDQTQWRGAGVASAAGTTGTADTVIKVFRNDGYKHFMREVGVIRKLTRGYDPEFWPKSLIGCRGISYCVADHECEHDHEHEHDCEHDCEDEYECDQASVTSGGGSSMVTIYPVIAYEYVRAALHHTQYSVQECGIILHNLASALIYLHKRDVVHCDIHVGNIRLEYNSAGLERAVLCDLGAAMTLDETQSPDAFCRGAVDYTAPEILMGLPWDTSADIFSLGVVMYLVLTGKYPFRDCIDDLMDEDDGDPRSTSGDGSASSPDDEVERPSSSYPYPTIDDELAERRYALARISTYLGRVPKSMIAQLSTRERAKLFTVDGVVIGAGSHIPNLFDTLPRRDAQGQCLAEAVRMMLTYLPGSRPTSDDLVRLM